MSQINTELFENTPIRKAVISLAFPTVLSQLVIVLYNMADTFFIGQIGDPNQVAAASLCLPTFFFSNCFSNLFGVGGASTISRFLGKKDSKNATSTFSFCLYTSALISIVYGIIIYFISPIMFPLFGSDEFTYDYCIQYSFYTSVLGAMPTVVNTAFSHFVRSEGYSKQASFGMMLGAFLNIVLDPIFIFTFKLEVRGAAIATLISNCIAVMYYVILVLRKKDNTILKFNLKYFTFKNRIPQNVFISGMPSALMSIMNTCSNITLNRLMANYANEAIAGVAVAKRIDLVCFAASFGMSQGIIPLVGYNYSAKNYERMKNVIKEALKLTIIISGLFSILLFTCARPIVKAFIDDSLTVYYGEIFQKIFCITGPCIAITLMITTCFQAMGDKIRPLFLSMLRKGGLDIPFMILMNFLVGVTGIAWATPIADTLAMIISIIVFIPTWRKIKNLGK